MADVRAKTSIPIVADFISGDSTDLIVDTTSGIVYFLNGLNVVTPVGANYAYTDEQVRDTVAAAFAAGTQSGITFTPNDPADSFSMTVASTTVLQPTVRQTVEAGSLSAGVPNALTTGSGVRPGLSATTTPLLASFANGFDANGSVDLYSRLTADASDPLGADLPLSTTSHLYAGYTSSSAVAWAATRIPPQYGEVFDKTRAASLHFEAADATVSMIDDYGNTWTAVGNAQIDTAQFKFGTASLLLDGTGDYIQSTDFTTLGGDSWTLEAWVRWGTLPTAGNTQNIFDFGQNATNFGVMLGINNTAGTTKLSVSLSSNASSADIASATLGTKTTWSTGTWYHIAITYDALAGKYFSYVDGVQDFTVTSALRICGLARARVGETIDATLTQLNGWVDEVRLSPCCRYPNGTTFTPSASAFTVEGHYFCIPEMKMYEVTSASATAATDPGMTRRDRVFVGEADTSGAAVTAARTYAYRGRGVSAQAAIAVATQMSFAHNIGTVPMKIQVDFICYTTDSGWAPGDVLRNPGTYDGVGNRQESFGSTRNIAYDTIGGTIPVLGHKTTGVAAFLVAANWKRRIIVGRGW